jgi:hypothetical protein
MDALEDINPLEGQMFAWFGGALWFVWSKTEFS